MVFRWFHSWFPSDGRVSPLRRLGPKVLKPRKPNPCQPCRRQNRQVAKVKVRVQVGWGVFYGFSICFNFSGGFPWVFDGFPMVFSYYGFSMGFLVELYVAGKHLTVSLGFLICFLHLAAFVHFFSLADSCFIHPTSRSVYPLKAIKPAFSQLKATQGR